MYFREIFSKKEVKILKYNNSINAFAYIKSKKCVSTKTLEY